MTNRLGGILALATVMALMSGCMKPPPVIVPAKGTVTLNGQPLPFAEIRFYPQEEKLPGEYIAVAVSDEKGHYELLTKGQPGVCTGAHVVTVAEGPQPTSSRGRSEKAQAALAEHLSKLHNRPIPPRYGNLALTPLTFTVTPEQSVYDIALQGN